MNADEMTRTELRNKTICERQERRGVFRKRVVGDGEVLEAKSAGVDCGPLVLKAQENGFIVGEERDNHRHAALSPSSNFVREPVSGSRAGKDGETSG